MESLRKIKSVKKYLLKWRGIAFQMLVNQPKSPIPLCGYRVLEKLQVVFLSLRFSFYKVYCVKRQFKSKVGHLFTEPIILLSFNYCFRIKLCFSFSVIVLLISNYTKALEYLSVLFTYRHSCETCAFISRRKEFKITYTVPKC